MKIILLFIVYLLSLTFANSQDEVYCKRANVLASNPVNSTPQNFDVGEYRANVFFNTEKMTLSGRVEVVFTLKDNQNPYLILNTYAMQIDSFSVNGKKCNISFQTDSIDTNNVTLRLSDFSTTNSPMDSNVAIIYYKGKIIGETGSNRFGGLFYEDNVLYNIGVCMKCSYVSTLRHWIPSYDHPSDKARFSIGYNIKAKSDPKNLKIVSIGNFSSGGYGSDSIVSANWWTDKQVATYLVNFAIGEFTAIYLPNENSISAAVHALNRDTIATKYNFQRFSNMLKCFEDKFGNYPYEKIDYVNTTLGAMEHQTLVSYPLALNNQALSSKNSINNVAAHELAHQWFGNLVTPYDFRDAWLTESFATFSEAIWNEYELDTTNTIKIAYHQLLRAKANRYLNTISKNEGIFPIYDFVRSGKSSNYPETIYQKGAVVLGMLRYKMGDSLFFGGLRSYLSKYNQKNANIDTLINTLNVYSNKNWDWFFKQWVRNAGYPRIDAKVTKLSNRKIRVDVSRSANQVNTNQYDSLDLEFLALTTNGNKTSLISLNQNESSKSQEIELDNDFTQLIYNSGRIVTTLAEVTITTATSIEETEDFSIYPNPVSEVLNFSKEFDNAKIYNSMGQLISEKFSSSFIEVSNLADGLYMVYFTIEGKNFANKFIVKK